MTGFELKVIACISMLIDHIGVVLYPDKLWLRYVGRLAFPIYCFFLSEGYCHTRNLRRYLLRLGIFAVISEVPFDLALGDGAWDPAHQNVYITLFLGLLLLYILENSNSLFIKAAATVSVMCIAQGIHCDYRYPGIWMILSFYYFRELGFLRDLNVAAVNIRLFPSKVQVWGSLSLIPLSLYNGKRGPSFKWAFYLFYPVHLIILWVLREYVFLT